MVLLYIRWNINDYRAYLYSSSANLTGLEKAIKLQPLNAVYQRFLGEYLWYRHDWQGAIKQYKTAIKLDPLEPRLWLDLAAAYQFTGDHKTEAKALETAVRLDPTNPATALEAANFYLVAGDVDSAVREFHIILDQSNDPEQVRLAFDRSWKATGDIDKLLAELVPATASAHLTLLDMLVARKEAGPAERVWSHLVSLHVPFDRKPAFGYFDYLIETKQVEQAQLVWSDLVARDSLKAYCSTGNLVVNGGFEEDLLNGGFDWRYRPLPDVIAEIDTTESHAGHRALLASFDGPPVAEIGVSQLIPVQPNTEYRFSAYMKTEDIEGGSGPRFVIEDAYTHERYLVSTDRVGSSLWAEEAADFTTGTSTTLVLLRIMRLPGDEPIRGKMWFDDVSLAARDRNF